jgi:hypothetical protein
MRYTPLLLLFVSLLNIMSVRSYISINILGTGMFLPYSMGVIGYIKEHFQLKDYTLTGVSGGAWCSLLFELENNLTDHDKIWNMTVGDPNLKIRLHNNLNVFQENIERNLKARYKDVPATKIQTMPLSVIATHYDNSNNKLSNEKKTGFKDVNDLIDFCLCSSYIPYLSGTLMCRQYDNKYYMDGDISRNKLFIETGSKPAMNTLCVHRNMWGRKFPLNNYIYTDINMSRQLFQQGWSDTEKNKAILQLLQK